MGGLFDGFINIYHGISDAVSSITFWGAMNVIFWTITSILGASLLYDMGITDGRYSEAELTSSREGEIEAVTEKHRV
jgi:hypothetical protein